MDHVRGSIEPQAGPLEGVRVLEFAGKGAAPYCGMLLSDLGADVVRVDRTDQVQRGPDEAPPRDRRRGRRSVAVDLKSAAGVEIIRRVLPRFDLLVEGYRPGVMERLSLGPQDCLELHPPLVYSRVTGWGQEGPYADRVGHDINFIAVASLLSTVGERRGRPIPPLNFAADGAGGMLAAFGSICALIKARAAGVGSVVDAAMLDAAASLMGSFYSRRPYGMWSTERGSNKVDGGAPFYATYLTADQRYVAVGAIESAFYADLLRVLDLQDAALPEQWDRDRWTELRAAFETAFKSRTRNVWLERAAGTSACLSPVLDMDEAPRDPHNVARETFFELDGRVEPSPAPRFDGRVIETRLGAARDGQHTREVLGEWGLSQAEVEVLESKSVVRQLGS